MECSITSQCLAITCCTDLDLQVIQRSVNVDIHLDLDNYVIALTFGEWSFNTTLFTYEWGKDETLMLGSAIQIR